MSQKSALPSLTAAVLSLMYDVSSGGSGTGIVSKAATRGKERAPASCVPPAAAHSTSPATAIASAIAMRSATWRPDTAALDPPPTTSLRTNFHPHEGPRPPLAEVSLMPLDTGRPGAGQRVRGICAGPRNEICANRAPAVVHPQMRADS